MVGNRFDEEIENIASIDSSGNLNVPQGIVTASPTSLIGYSTGAGGAVTQLTNKSTAVTINKVCGTITTSNEQVDAAEEKTFVVHNTTVAATDVIAVSIVSGGTAKSYELCVGAVAANSFNIVLSNPTAGNLSEILLINFSVIKGSSS